MHISIPDRSSYKWKGCECASREALPPTVEVQRSLVAWSRHYFIQGSRDGSVLVVQTMSKDDHPGAETDLIVGTRSRQEQQSGFYGVAG